MKKFLVLSVLVVLFLPAFVIAQSLEYKIMKEVDGRILTQYNTEKMAEGDILPFSSLADNSGKSYFIPDEIRPSAAAYEGYIVEFNEKSVLEYEEFLDNKLDDLQEAVDRLEKEMAGVVWYDILGHISNIFKGSEANEKKGEISKIKTDKPGLLKEQEREITELHVRIKLDMIKDRITGMITSKGSDSKTLGEFKNVFSGIALDISDEKAKEVEKLDYVKKVHPNYFVETTLMDSVPLINADDVWKMKDSEGKKLTGEGITIAIIDTGIDYTHPDLGGCFGQRDKEDAVNVNLGEQETVVILLSFEDDGTPNEDYVHDSNIIVFDYLDSYIREISYEKAWLSGNIAGPYTVSNEGCVPAGSGSNHKLILEMAIEAADDDIDFRDYKRIIIFNKDPNQCPHSPQGSIGIVDESSSYYNWMVSDDGRIYASVLWYSPGLDINIDNNQVLVHEFGHNLGLTHVDNYICTDDSGNMSTISDSCQSSGKSMSDPMGAGGRDAHYNAYNKELIGWLSDENIVTTRNGSYFIEPLETSSDGIKIIKIPIPYLPYQYFMEFRIPVGFDEYDPWGYPLDGVFLYANWMGSKYTFLLDPPPFPELGSFEFSSLGMGQTYVDDYGISITVESVSEEGAHVTISKNSEVTQCSDGVNNDGFSDTYVDGDDFSCLVNSVYDATHISEYEPLAACQDGVDNDGDGKTDLSDPDCEDTQDNSENGDTSPGTCKVIGGYDFVNNDNDPMDDNGHGTHCAGISAGDGALKGVAPGAKLYAYKILNSNGLGSGDQIISAIEMAVDPNQDGDFSDHVDVISMSLGGLGNPDDPMSKAVDNAVEAGVIAAIAAGNNGPNERTINSPGTSRKAITVGAVDKNDNIPYFSSRGPVKWINGHMVKPDVVAPGVSICAAQYNSAWNESKCLDDNHVAISGTSMATPHVAGAAALLKQKNPGWTPGEIKTALRNTAKEIGFDIFSQGHGRIDVLAAAGLENPPPMGVLETSGNLEGIVTIKGRIHSDDFDKYELSISRMENASDWNVIYSTDVYPANDVLYDNFNTLKINDGKYFLRLRVSEKNGQVTTDYTIIEINRIEVISPLNYDIFNNKDAIEIRAKILEGTIPDGIYVEWGVGKDPSSWSTAGMTIINEDDLLAEWDMGTAIGTGYYTIKASIEQSGITDSESVIIYVDAAMRKGWPVRITFQDCPLEEGCVIWPGYLQASVDDTDSDGDKEIVIYSGGDPPNLTIYNDDGSVLSEWEVGEKDGWGFFGGNLHKPVIGDVDNDGSKEIVVIRSFFGQNRHSVFHVFNQDGSEADGWPVNFNDVMPGKISYKAEISLEDLDLDGDLEIIYFEQEGGFAAVFSNDGNILPGWPVDIKCSGGGGIVSHPAVGNFDEDPELEFVIGNPSPDAGYNRETGEWDNTGIIHVFNMDGTEVDGWPVETEGFIYSSPALGDVDNDGHNDIVIGTMYFSNVFPDYNYGGIYVFHRNGSVMDGWPFQKGYNFWSSPALVDFNDDGYLEIAESRLGFVTYLLDYRGRVLDNWPRYTTWNDYSSSIAGDVNGDGQTDILTTAGNGFSFIHGGGVYAWDMDGNLLEGFPKFTDADAQAAALISDLDNNGEVEIVASSDWDYDFVNNIEKLRGSIYVWDTGDVYDDKSMEWPQFHHDYQYTGLYGKNISELPPPPNKTDILIDFVTFNVTSPVIKARNTGTKDLHISDVEINGDDVSYTVDDPLIEPTKTKSIYVQESYREGERLEIVVETLEGESSSKTVRVPRETKPREISVEDITFSMLRLEALYAELDSVEKALREIGDYYKSIGDSQKANEYYAVADMVLDAMKKIDDMKKIVNDNIDNLEDIGEEFYQDIKELKELVNDTIDQIGVLKVSM